MGLRVQGFPFIYQESVCACMLSQPGSLYLVGIRPLAPILITLSCLLRPCSLPLPKCWFKKNRVNPLAASVLFLYPIHSAAYVSVPVVPQFLSPTHGFLLSIPAGSVYLDLAVKWTQGIYPHKCQSFVLFFLNKRTFFQRFYRWSLWDLFFIIWLYI